MLFILIVIVYCILVVICGIVIIWFVLDSNFEFEWNVIVVFVNCDKISFLIVICFINLLKY